MQYQGGKSRIAKQISEVINEIPRRQIENFKTDSRNNKEHYVLERERERVIQHL